MSTIDDLAVHAATTWPVKGISAADWADALEGRDLDLAKAVLSELRRGGTPNVRPTDFTSAYRRRTPEKPVCPHCSGTGKIPDPDSTDWQPESVPCTCPEGDRMDALQRSMAPAVFRHTDKRLSESTINAGLSTIAAIKQNLAEQRARSPRLAEQRREANRWRAS